MEDGSKIVLRRFAVRLKAAALSLAFCCCALAPALAVEATPSPPSLQAEADRAMEFLFAMTHADQVLKESMVEAAESELAKAIVVSALADTRELRGVLAASVSAQISAADLQAVDAFVQSGTGQVLSGIFVASADSAETAAAVDKLPQAQQEQILAFIASTPMANLVAALESEQTVQAAREWGEKIGCQYFKQRPELYDPAILQSAGKCQ